MIGMQTKTLLLAGIAAGVIFLGVTAVEIFARTGFDIKRHAVSVLSLGERGWLMVATFILSGLFVVLFAAGLRQTLSGGWMATWGPAFIALYGIGLVLAGIFPAPAGLGFPPGTPHDQMPVMTPTAIIHSIAFMVGFSSLIAACVVFAFYVSAPWSALFAIAAFLMPVLIALGMANAIATGIAFYLAAIVGWLAVAALAIKLWPN